MRVALLSDIHGNLVAFDAVLADMAQQTARHGPFDEVVIAGDLVWAGPWPAEVVDRVRSLNATVIQGNTDTFFARAPAEVPPRKREERFVTQLSWMQEQLGPKRAAYLAGLPFARRITPAPTQNGASNCTLLVVHANPHDQERVITPHMPDADLDELLDGTGEWAALAFGHVHIPFVRRWRGRLLVNVASVGLPMDGDQRAAYAILTWDGAAWHTEHRRVLYPLPVVTHQMRSSGMPRGKHFAERLMSASYGPNGPAVTE